LIEGQQSNLQELLPDLLALGFSEYEARAYVALYKLQPATAYEVSKLAGLPKANAYTVLESLSKKEAAQPISESPVRYVAVEPGVLFERIASATARRCAKLIERIPAVTDAHDRGYVWSISGADAIDTKIESMIEGAGSHIWIKAAETNILPYRDALQRAAERGVGVLIILFGAHPEQFQLGGKSRTYLHEGNGIPVGIAHKLVTITVDFEEALVVEIENQPHGAYTRNRPIVNLAESLIRHEVYFAEIFEMFGQPIQKTFGPALMELRRKYLPRPQVDALEQLLGLAGPTGKAAGGIRKGGIA
jgi:HTH-type transcriptional regulator, sugar sensing transcriptional regulator